MNSKIICLCCFADAARYLPEFIDHLEPYVDGFLWLDDDRHAGDEGQSATIAYGEPKTIGVICRYSPNKAPFAYELRNRFILMLEALNEGATSILALDADERIGKPTLSLLREYDGAEQTMGVHVRDCWNSKDQYRIDPPWNLKNKPVLFPRQKIESWVNSGAVQLNALHQPWVPVHHFNVAGDLFHLGSLTPELRAERVRRHNAADPDKKWQASYDYLADETGLTLETIPEGRGWK